MFKDTTDDESESKKNSDTGHTRRSYLTQTAATTAALGVGTGVMGTAAAQLEDETASEQEAAQLQQLQGEWPQFRFNQANTGFASDETGPDGPVSPRWVFPFIEFARESINESPAVVDGTVYFGSSLRTSARDAIDGSEEWENFRSSESPAVVDGTVYTADFLSVFALNATDGTQQWSSETEGLIFGNPSVADGTVYIGDGASNLYALDATDGTEQWVFEAEANISSTPAVVDGTVYVGSSDTNVYAVDATDGTEQWSYQTGDFIFSSPAVADGVVYVGSRDGNVYALDASDGNEEWVFETGSSVNSSPAVADGIVYVGSADSNVYALDASDGSVEWTFETGGSVRASPAVADGVVYVGSTDNNVYALDAIDGTEQWTFETGGSVSASPALAGGTVYVGSDDNNLYAIEESTADPAASIAFEDQDSDGLSVVVDQVDLSQGGFVEITDADGTVLGQSEVLETGTSENVAVTLSPAIEQNQELTATAYRPSGEPYVGPDDEPVSATAFITLVDPVQPTASITFDDQKSDGARIVIQQVELSAGGFVEITDADGVVRGQTANIDAETRENLEVDLNPPLAETQPLTATVFRDINAPYLDDGEPVSATAVITVRPGEELPEKKRQQKKRAYKRKKSEYEKAKKKYEKDQLSKKEVKKKRGAYEQAKHEYKECK